MIIIIDDQVILEQTAFKHTAGLFSAIDRNRVHLSEFLPWVQNMQTLDDIKKYLEHCNLLYEEKKEISFVILVNRIVSGRIGLSNINISNKAASIGYWLSKDAEGQGIITKACKILIDFGFNKLELHRIEIKAAAKNNKSQAIPQKLNFKKEGILRDAEYVNTGFVDLVLFSMLKNEWK